MKTAKMIATMAINEVRAAHEMYEALLSREYNFNELIADICMEMNHDIINTIHGVKSTEVDFDMCKYHERFDNLLYKVHSILMIAGYIDRADVEEMINNIEKQFIKSIEQVIEEYIPA
ncbi:hypothetical protein [Methanoculleus sp.]|uniref:hypothetical protein n=1 Tax=Methanoculleus sp. TaxID=90427 RepID=UPI0025EB11A9|nr:hypothetical protein [Methanoculleus sp.]MCK9319505.1 hypothetical protein [Methanoculleus sp.]